MLYHIGRWRVPSLRQLSRGRMYISTLQVLLNSPKSATTFGGKLYVGDLFQIQPNSGRACRGYEADARLRRDVPATGLA